MKVLQIIDSPKWAIGKLTKVIRDYNPHINFNVIYVHPREVENHIEEVKKALSNFNPDIIDFQYWNTARQLLERIPELSKFKLILNHHNQKDVLAADWKNINTHIAHTRYAAEKLVADGQYENVEIIQYGVNPDYFTFDQEYKRNRKLVGYCGRIVPWKGLKEVARACFELGYELAIMGKMDRPAYWEEIPEEYRINMDISYMNCDDDDRIRFYRDISIYVGNSGPNHEEGTLPLLEAMMSGVPVITTPSGIAADTIDDMRHAIITPFGDYEALKSNIKLLMEDSELRDQLRKEGWNLAKIHTENRYAWEISKVYSKVHGGEAYPLVSVILPTYKSKENVIKILDRLEEDEWKNLEVIVADDASGDDTDEAICDWREKHNLPVKIVYTDCGKSYGLAQARNRAIIEAQGEYLIFCDSRVFPNRDAITNFITKLRTFGKDDRVWVFGDKGAHKESFVENFSAARRDHIIRMGMFCERIEQYGGMTQEVRTRATWQKFECVYEPNAKSVMLQSSHMTEQRRKDIIKSKLTLWKMGMR